MKIVVLSGAFGHVLSGARDSCYQAHGSTGKPRQATIFGPRNLSN